MYWVVPCPRSSLGTGKQLGGSVSRAAAASSRDAAAVQTRMQGAAPRAGRQPDLCAWKTFECEVFPLPVQQQGKKKQHSEFLPSPGDSSELSLC